MRLPETLYHVYDSYDLRLTANVVRNARHTGETELADRAYAAFVAGNGYTNPWLINGKGYGLKRDYDAREFSVEARRKALDDLIPSDRITTKRGTTHAAYVKTADWYDPDNAYHRRDYTASSLTSMVALCGSRATGEPQPVSGGNPVSCKRCLRKLRKA